MVRPGVNSSVEKGDAPLFLVPAQLKSCFDCIVCPVSTCLGCTIDPPAHSSRRYLFVLWRHGCSHLLPDSRPSPLSLLYPEHIWDMGPAQSSPQQGDLC